MPAFNSVIMVGNLTKDPQLSYTPKQTAVVDFGLAVNRKWKQDGSTREDTCFIDVRGFAGLADVLVKYCKKGSCVLVNGYLAFEKWEDKKEGKQHSRHRLIAQTVQFLDGKGKPDGAADGCSD